MDTYAVVLFKHELIPLILSTHSKQLAFEFHGLLNSLLRCHVLVLHLLLYLLLHQLFLSETFTFGLLGLSALELQPLLFLHFPAFIVSQKDRTSSSGQATTRRP